MFKKENNYYYASFVELITFSKEAAELLMSIVIDYDSGMIESQVKKMHDIEHSADLRKHALMEKLVKEFITPIEREDITLLVNKIDNVTDTIEDILLQLYMYNVTSLLDGVVDFVKMIIKSIDGLEMILKEFPNYKKSALLKQGIIEVNDIEEKADRLYTELARKLFTTVTDPVTLNVWNDIYRQLEACCDACEDVADSIEGIIMKNS